jgi:hypothetical protein
MPDIKAPDDRVFFHKLLSDNGLKAGDQRRATLAIRPGRVKGAYKLDFFGV